MFGGHEIRLAEWMGLQTSQKLRVSRLAFIKQALEFFPNKYMEESMPLIFW